VIRAHVRVGDIVRAKAALKSLRAIGLEPDCLTFNELMEAVAMKDGPAMWHLFSEMEALGVQPNAATCSIVLKGIKPSWRAAEVERAFALAERMGEAMDEVCFAALCDACIRTGHFELLAKQLERHRLGRAPAIKSAHAFGTLVRAYGSMRDMDGAWETWRDMQARRITPSSVAVGCMVEAVANNESPEAGYALIHEVRANPHTRPLVNAIIYCSVLKGFSHRKLFHRVWEVHDEMRQQKLQYSIVTYNTLIDACIRSGEMTRILLCSS